MSYTINVTNHDTITIATGAIDTSTSLTLIGKNVPNYGQAIAQDLVKLMQNFAGTSTPPGPVDGQLYYDTNINALRLCRNGIFDKVIASTSSGVSAPTGNYIGDFWWDTATSQLKVYNGSGWTAIGPYVVNQNASTLATTIIDSTNVSRDVLLFQILGTTILIISSTTFVPKNTVIGFPIIKAGLTLASDLILPNNQLYGNVVATTVTATTISPTNASSNIGSNSNKWQAIYATTFSGTASSAQYADLAERYESDAYYEAGTVVMIGGEKEITRCDVATSADVFGVISTNPAYLMNDNKTEDNWLPVVLVGRAPVKVIGTVKKGQRLVSAGNGYARAANEVRYETVIGRALVDKNDEVVEAIECYINTN
jgi:hypothetical protein